MTIKNKTHRIIIGAEIKKARKQRGLTQKELAELVGYSERSIRGVELGGFSIGIDQLIKVCNELDVSISINHKVINSQDEA